MAKSIRKGSASKPSKPYPDFPLFPHATRRWAKKIRGKLHYFGPWTDEPDGGAAPALAKYQEQAGDLHAGRTPRARGDGLTVRKLCNRFLTSKRHLLDTEEIMPRTFQERISDERLKAVTDYVRWWLFADAAAVAPEGAGIDQAAAG